MAQNQTAVSIYITNWLKKHDKSQAQLATEAGLSQPVLNQILSGRVRLTPVRAVALEGPLNTSAEKLLTTQMNEELAKIRTENAQRDQRDKLGQTEKAG